MANDLLLIKCDGCGAWTMLMKFFPGNFKTRGDTALDWLDAHGKCHPNFFKPDLEGIPGFSLHTEDAIGEVLLPEKQNGLPPYETPH